MSKLFVFLFLLILIPLVSAEPPFAEEGAGSFSSGFFVEFTPIGTHKNLDTLQINAHVFNISNGVEIDNTTTMCRASLFNETGHHIINSVNMSYVDIPIGSGDWEFTILGGNFTKNLEFSYLVDCQDLTNNLGGFVAVEFIVTADGHIYDQARAFTYISLLVLLIFMLIVNVGSIVILPNGNIKNEIGDLLSINYLKYLTYILYPLAWFLIIAVMFTASNIGISTGITLFGDLFFSIFQIMMRITPVMLVIWFLWILVSIFRDREFKKLLDRGIDFGGNI